MSASEPSIENQNRKRVALLTALLALLVLIAFLPVLRRDFQFVEWDDPTDITGNVHIRSLDWPTVRWMFTDTQYVRRYIPLSWLGWAINYQLASKDPSGKLDSWSFHAGNVLFHVLTSVLLFFVLRQLLRAARIKGDALIDWCAVAGTAVWAVHPMRVETVAWATGRIYPQSGFFFLLSLSAYLFSISRSRITSVEGRSRSQTDDRVILEYQGASQSSWQSRLWKTIAYWFSVVAFAASLCTHQLAITMIGLLLVIDVYPLRRLPLDPRRWLMRNHLRVLLEKVPFVLVTAGIVAVTLWARANASGIWLPPPTYTQFPLGQRLLQTFYIFAHYLWKPYPGASYSPVYTSLVQIDGANIMFWGSMVLVLLITVVTAMLWKSWPALLALWVCHLILLVPVIGWTELPHYPSDRYSYLQAMLFAAGIAGLLAVVWPRATNVVRKVAILFVAALVCAGGVRAYQQNFVWRNSESLFRHILAELGNDPYSAEIYWRLGRILNGDGRIQEAMEVADRGVQANPKLFEALRFRGETLLLAIQTGSISSDAVPEAYRQAGAMFDQAIIVGGGVDEMIHAADAYGAIGAFDHAEVRIRMALSLKLQDPELWLRLGAVETLQGRAQNGAADFDQAAKLNPALAPKRGEILEQWAKAAAAIRATTPPAMKR